MGMKTSTMWENGTSSGNSVFFNNNNKLGWLRWIWMSGRCFIEVCGDDLVMVSDATNKAQWGLMDEDEHEASFLSFWCGGWGCFQMDEHEVDLRQGWMSWVQLMVLVYLSSSVYIRMRWRMRRFTMSNNMILDVVWMRMTGAPSTIICGSSRNKNLGGWGWGWKPMIAKQTNGWSG